MNGFVKKIVIFISLAVSCVRCYPDYWNNAILSPVHGLYVKPSGDGATGDLFVAATEDNGVKSQWIVDKPINFLPLAAASQPQAAILSMFPASIDESSSKKRAVLPSPVPNQPVQYAYALPVTSTEGSPVPSFPYAYPIPSPPTENSANKCDSSTVGAQYPFQYPFHFFYPQMMSAYTNAMSILKDAGFNEDTAGSIIPQASPMWPPTPYTYPMYVMVNPGGCSQVHSTTTSSTTASAPSEEES